MRVRISIRGLFIITALMAAFCYWRDRPRQMANRFVRAIEARDQAALDRLVTGDSRTEDMFSLLGNAATDALALREVHTFFDWIKGERRLVFVIDGPGNLENFHVNAVASSTGVTLQDVARSGGLRIYVK